METKKDLPLIQQVAQMLNKTVTNTVPNNVELNRNLWDNYARTWDTDKPWIKQMIKDV